MPSKNAKPISARSAARKRTAAAAPARLRNAKNPPKASKSRPRATTVTLAAECTLAQTVALHSMLTSAFAKASDVVIDAAAITRIDAASVQLLGAFVRDRKAKSLRTCWKSPSSALAQAAARLGLTELLELEPAAQARA